MTVVVAIVGVLVGGSMLAMLWLSFMTLWRRLTRHRIEGQAERLRKVLATSRAENYKGLAKLLFEMRDTFDPQVLDAQIQAELGDGSKVASNRLIAAVNRLGLAERYLTAVREAPAWRDRAQAAHALGALGEPRAAEPLVEGMRDPHEDRDVKLACAEALGRIRNLEVIPLLCQQLTDIDEWSSPRIAAILTSFGDVATESLLATLDHGESLNARVWAAQILGKIGARVAVAPLRDRLHDRSEQMRLSAANALGDIGDVRAVRSLIDVALRDPTPAVRAQAAQGLGKLGDPEALPILVAALGDPEYWMRFRALEAIEQLRPTEIETIEHALGDTSPEVRRRAALALERLGLLDESFAALAQDDDDAALARERLIAVGRAGLSERFVRHLYDSSPIVRENTAQILGDVGDPNHAEELERHLSDEDKRVRRAAARSLGALAVESTAPALIRLIDSDDAELAEEAVVALRRFGGGRIVAHTDVLAEMLESESDRARVRATIVLADVPGIKVDELLLSRGLGDRFVEARLAAVRGLGARRLADAVDPIGALLADPYEPLRVAAATALSEIGGDRSVDLLLARMARAGRKQREAICRGIAALGYADLGGALDILLGDADVNARIGATWVLGNTTSSEAVPLLAALVKDSEARVRSSAAGALSKIPGDDSYRVLRASHDDPNQFVRAAVVNAIGARGAADDFSILEERAGDPDDYVRNRAVIALGRIGTAAAAELIERVADQCEAPHRVVALGLTGDPSAIGDAVASLDDAEMRTAVAALIEAEPEEIRRQFILNLGLAHAPDGVRDAFAASLEPSPLVSKLVADLRNQNLEADRLRALKTLARLRSRDATTGLAAAARHDPSPQVRVAAVAALAGRSDDVDAVNVLTASLIDPAPSVRAEALAAVGSLGQERFGARVLASLGAVNRSVADAAIKSASHLYSGAKTSQLVDWLMGQTKAPVLVDGLAVLGAMSDPSTRDVLIAFGVSPLAPVREAAVKALARLGDVLSTRAVVARIGDPDASVRRVAIALAPKGIETLTALKVAASDPDIDVRSACAERLGRSEQAEAILVLEEMGADSSARVIACALGSLLASRTPEGRAAFVRVAGGSGDEVVSRVARDHGPALAVVSVDAVGALTKAERLTAIAVLVSLRTSQLADDIGAALADPEPEVRLAAARGLASFGLETLDDRLRLLATDPVASVRAEVRRLLIRSV